MNRIQDAQIEDKKVLLRVDFNVPLLASGEIENDKRIREALPTIQYLLDSHVAKITIVSHLGKPDGRKDESLSLYSVANRFAELLKIGKKFNGPADEYEISDRISMLENIRFNPGEEKNDPAFAKVLAAKADLFVFDAFGTAHRAHASTEGITHLLPSFAGLLVQKEVENLDKLLKEGQEPYTIILGGAKIADKLPVVKNLMVRADNFLIGGAIANTFLAARRHFMGKSLIEKDEFRQANIIWQNLMDEVGKSLYLPKDLTISLSEKKADDVQEIDIENLMEPKFEEYAAVDIGRDTIAQFESVIKGSKTIFWNGNMGISEINDFAHGTKAIALALKKLANNDVQIVIGGGDTVAAAEAAGLETNGNVFLSTGGGATLEYLAGKVLPGLKAYL